VENWALKVADGYDTRAIFNRQAVYGGALIAGAATSALVGLSAFNTADDVITALPIGATFLGGTMAIYNNEQKAVIYGSASQTIRDVLIQSDYMQALANWTADGKGSADGKAQASICLHAEVSELIRRVNNHITLLDPKNVADQLKSVAASVQKKQAAAVNEQADAQAAQGKAKGARAMARTLQTAANKAPEAQRPAAQKKADAAVILAAQADTNSATATKEADKATTDAKEAQDENTVQSVAAAAYDFSDLQELPKLKDTQLENYCFPEAAK
jgi:hypothetical protein